MSFFQFLQAVAVGPKGRSVVARIAVALAALATTLAVAGASQAQTVTISQTGITRTNDFRSDQTKRYDVSRADCLADDVMSFPVTLANYTSLSLEVWATQGADDCSNATYRTTTTATCWRVYRTLPTSNTLFVPIRVQDIAQKPPAGTTDGIGLGSEASCDSTVSSAQPVVLHFMLLQGATAAGTPTTFSTNVDLLGPAPPVIGSVGPGGQLLKIGWTASNNGEVIGYRVFCEKLGPTDCEGGISGSGGSAGAGGSGGTSGSGGSSGSGASDAGQADVRGDTSATDVTTDANARFAQFSRSSQTDDEVCVSTTYCSSSLVAGNPPTADQLKNFQCGSATGISANSATVDGLTNYTRYAVAVAAIDGVENVGPLSLVQCEMPQRVRGFDEEYVSAGGKAGGASFCSVSFASASARGRVGFGVASMLGLLIVLRRRRAVSR